MRIPPTGGFRLGTGDAGNSASKGGGCPRSVSRYGMRTAWISSTWSEGSPRALSARDNKYPTWLARNPTGQEGSWCWFSARAGYPWGSRAPCGERTGFLTLLWPPKSCFWLEKALERDRILQLVERSVHTAHCVLPV